MTENPFEDCFRVFRCVGVPGCCLTLFEEEKNPSQKLPEASVPRSSCADFFFAFSGPHTPGFVAVVATFNIWPLAQMRDDFDTHLT